MTADIHNRSTRRPLLRRLRQSTHRPGIDQGIGREAARCIEKGGCVARCGIEGCDRDDETDDGDAVIDHDVESTLFHVVGVPGDEEGTDRAEKVRRRSQNESNGIRAESKASDHGREEVVEAVR